MFSGSYKCKKNPHPCTFHGRNPADTYISAAQFSLYEKYSIYDKHTYLSDLYQTPDENGNTIKENANADGTTITLKTNEKERTLKKESA